MLRVQLWGTRGSITSPGPATQRYGGNTSCIQVVGFDRQEPGAALPGGNAHLILDGGTGLAALQTTLMRGPWGRGQGELHLLLSHYHWDHLIGLPFFRPMFVKGNRIAFYGASIEDLRSSIEQLFTSVYSPLNGTQNIAADLEYRELELGGTPVGGFHVRAVHARHTSPTLAVRVQYGPHAVVYAPDHGAGDAAIDARLVALARGANLWILDAHLTPERSAEGDAWWHTSHTSAVKLALEAGVDALALFHHDPAHDDDMLDRMGQEAAELAAGTRLQVLMARDGMVMDVGTPASSRRPHP